MKIFAAAGILCLVYGVYVRSMHSGTRFYLVWFGTGAVLIASGILYSSISETGQQLIVDLYLIILIVFLFCLRLILREMHADGAASADAVIVLGAQVRASGPSKSLQHRLDAAYGWLLAHPEAVCVVSGGRGANEPCTEAKAMMEDLCARGIPADRILLEESSTSTLENLKMSGDLYDLYDRRTVIVTNDFHMYRSLMLARHLGYTDVSGLAAASTLPTLPNNLLREVLCLMKECLLGRYRKKKKEV